MVARRNVGEKKPPNEPAKAAAADVSGVYLDPKLAEIRDAEVKKLETVVVEPRPEPTIDPALVRMRDAEIKRGDKKLV